MKWDSGLMMLRTLLRLNGSESLSVVRVELSFLVEPFFLALVYFFISLNENVVYIYTYIFYCVRGI